MATDCGNARVEHKLCADEQQSDTRHCRTGRLGSKQEVLVIKARWCVPGGCAVKGFDSYLGEILPRALKGEDVETV